MPIYWVAPMPWYLIHTKPRQEKVALENLERQGYVCLLPMLKREKLRKRAIDATAEPLFPRYLFLQINDKTAGRGLAPIRSTRGVSRLVSFGPTPVEVTPRLIEWLRSFENRAPEPVPLFVPGEKVIVTTGPFSGLEAVYKMADGVRRAMILIEILHREVQLSISPADLRKCQ
ncbi:transcription/translation regulatory transformer protein RfaH [Herbaspirillum sp. GW103]|uniref:transcription/translation regulatory transformer protein RfaH n=1 Tax=Herbaspirillum sp. GW103 TaxID=1175306 RepID=UPI00192CA4E1